MVIEVVSLHLVGLLSSETGELLSWLEVEFDVAPPAIGRNHLEGVDTETVDATDRARNSARAEELHHSVDTLWLVDVEVPELTQLASSGKEE